MKSKRIAIKVSGIVEGVGFRPFVYKLAKSLCLGGWVKNDTDGVYIEVEGRNIKIKRFLNFLKTRSPRPARIFSIKVESVTPLGEKSFRILPSSSKSDKFPVIPPDIAMCEECKAELFEITNRRSYYPFITCTNCGPRFSIVEDVPYDRSNTTMEEFKMCKFCRAEYEEIEDRRFHAQPIACFKCGPYLRLFDSSGNLIFGQYPSEEDERREYTLKVIDMVSQLILGGSIVAIKGIGGFQLVCRADDDRTVRRLRERKRREEKPFALMFRSIEDVEKYCFLSRKERVLLASHVAPILLLRKKNNIPISNLVSPKNPFLGCMLPYSPLHALIMNSVKIPVVCTSGNLSDEPICISEDEAFDRLRGIADYFLVHNRRIVRHVDDSVVRITPCGNQIIIRRARGLVPEPIVMERKLLPVLAVGGHLKNTIAVTVENFVILSQHIGDLETYESIRSFEKTVEDFLKFYNVKPAYIVCDQHPDYASTHFAEELSCRMGIPLVRVQHHFAHVLSVMSENNILNEEVIGVGWDGTGYGDGEIWGSEFLFVSKGNFERMFHFLPIPLIGGERAIKEVYRIGIALLLSSSLGDEAFRIFGNEKNFSQIVEMFNRGVYVNSCGAGRLFDGVSAIVGISRYSKFDGQSAMELEFALYFSDKKNVGSYSYDISGNVIDWRKIVLGVVEDLRKGVPKEVISLKFHNTVVSMIVEVVEIMSRVKRVNKVALSGGVFQNGFILDGVVKSLSNRGFEVFIHRKVPPNDGGLSLGQSVYPTLMRG